ncbi:MAG: hypothetical protein OES79_09640, partial [Planctomycetota bacterium]|nr:hypothetical protein [Planctomycetota bacterium]
RARALGGLVSVHASRRSLEAAIRQDKNAGSSPAFFHAVRIGCRCNRNEKMTQSKYARTEKNGERFFLGGKRHFVFIRRSK